MNDSRTDQQVVTDHIAGDPTALAAIYDRYADLVGSVGSDRHQPRVGSTTSTSRAAKRTAPTPALPGRSSPTSLTIPMPRCTT